jgi:hypothetical protein
MPGITDEEERGVTTHHVTNGGSNSNKPALGGDSAHRKSKVEDPTCEEHYVD